jgi:hypothetical protein
MSHFYCTTILLPLPLQNHFSNTSPKLQITNHLKYLTFMNHMHFSSPIECLFLFTSRTILLIVSFLGYIPPIQLVTHFHGMYFQTLHPMQIYFIVLHSGMYFQTFHPMQIYFLVLHSSYRYPNTSLNPNLLLSTSLILVIYFVTLHPNIIIIYSNTSPNTFTLSITYVVWDGQDGHGECTAGLPR